MTRPVSPPLRLRPIAVGLRMLCLIALALLPACRPSSPPEPPPAPEPTRSTEPLAPADDADHADPPAQAAPAASTDAPEPVAAAPEGTVVARVRAVDLDGAPIAGIIPIAAAQANAFDPPATEGAPTDADGRGALAIPAHSWMYVRGWDPELKRFANNIYDIPPGEGVIADELTLIMVDAATLEMTLYDAEGVAVADEAVGLMMLHPERGPWWPAESHTDAAGVARFPNVPPGAYQLRIKAAESGMIELPTVTLLPDAVKDLGAVGLLPQ